MKGISIRSVLFAGVLVLVSAATARANTITPTTTAPAPTGFTSGVSITYEAVVTSGELHFGDGFTIFDIGGFTAVLATPADWTFSTSATTSPFGTPLGPDAFDTNVHFTWIGSTTDIGFAIYSSFIIGTTALATTIDDWVSRDHLLNPAGDGALGPETKAVIVVPAHVPDGGSTAALLGSVLFAFGMLRRRFS
jgi:hypothetical protein